MDFLISIMSKNTSIVELFCIEKLEKMIKLRMEDRKLGDGQLEYIEKVRNIIRDFSLKTGIPINILPVHTDVSKMKTILKNLADCSKQWDLNRQMI